MNKRKHITIRPRVGSALERVYDHKRDKLAGLAHEWAEADEQGWLEQFKTNNATPEGERE